MKTLKTIIPALALMLTFTFAKAEDNDNGKLTKNYAISTYVDAITLGKVDGLSEILDNDTKFCVLQGKKVTNYGRTEMLNHLAGLKNIKQACTTTTTLVEDNSEVTVLKVDMQYANFVRSNYVTIAKTGDGWKITNVCSVFK
ncbi:hypothetical protein DJ568_13210 [Mucilaginibacter hurinus]|uniref:Nuclear transport factor 2 family protein n=1 Tax=Mucilaginibacter hurinus TaxID=2201324 RepID=A0A367GLP4_9SPHI|nr:nuclear transport factor 2 family protein [Mucilaginibacter hurinus]RCH54250.1 hypothetical protein DJ568_13210 [Mucilaginibacter hurinus]